MIESFDISDLLPRLVDRSLVHYDEATGRYRLLETVRQYAAEHSLNFEHSGVLRDRHLDYYIEITQDFRHKVRGSEQVEWLSRLDDEYDNVRLALDWALSSDTYFDDGVKLMYRIYDYWQVRGHFQEAQSVLDRIASDPRSLKPENRARHRLIQSSVSYFRAETEPELVNEGLDIARELNDPVLYGDALCITILGLLRIGRLEDARKLEQPALQALAAVGDRVMSAFVHINFGNTALARRNLDEAEEHYKECYRLRKEMRDLRGVGAALCSLGYIDQYRGNEDEAIRLFREGNAILWIVGSGWDLGGGLPSSCLELVRESRYEDAARVLGYSEMMLKRIKGERDDVDGPNYHNWVKVVREHLGEEEFQSLFRAGYQMGAQAMREMLYPDGIDVDAFGDKEV